MSPRQGVTRTVRATQDGGETVKRHQVHDVIVGNVGTVYSGANAVEARSNFDTYKRVVHRFGGRAYMEEVTWLTDGDVQAEYDPKYDREMTWLELKQMIDDMPPAALGQPVRLATRVDDDGPVQTEKKFA